MTDKPGVADDMVGVVDRMATPHERDVHVRDEDLAIGEDEKYQDSVRTARREEMDFMRAIPAFEKVDIQECWPRFGLHRIIVTGAAM